MRLSARSGINSEKIDLQSYRKVAFEDSQNVKTDSQKIN